MKTKLITLLFLLFHTSSLASENTLPDASKIEAWWGSKGEGKILKVYSVQWDNELFRAYAVKWKGKEIVVQADLSRREKSKGEIVQFFYDGFDVGRDGKKFKMLRFVEWAPDKSSASKSDSLKSSGNKQKPLQVGVRGTLPPMDEGKILKVYSAEWEKERFRAFVVEWRGKEIVVSEETFWSGLTDVKKAGDTLRFGIHKSESERNGEKIKILSFSNFY